MPRRVESTIMKHVTFGAAIAALSLTMTAAAAEKSVALPELVTRVTSVALFKNGLAVFTRAGRAPDAAGDYELASLPPPVHGTVWATAGSGVTIEAIVVEESDRAAVAMSIGELLRANLGERVVVALRGPSTARLEGTIVAVGHPEELDQALAFARRNNPGYYPAGDMQDTLLLLRADGGTSAVAIASVETAEFAGRAERGYEKPGQRWRVRFARTQTGRDFALTYAAKGASWAPSYRVDLGRDGKATLSASAIVINEAEALEAARLELITGVPNLKFADVVSPLALTPGLAAFLTTLDQDPGQRRYGVVASQRGGVYAEGSGAGVPAYGIAAVGVQQEDLFFYPLADVTLAKGSVGWYPLFSMEVPFRHVYQWEIPDYVSEEDTYQGYGGARQPQVDEEAKLVWHTIRLENAGSIPWTTAPAETVADGALLGQDILAYTPRGARATLRITRAPNVRVEESEVEVSREQQPVTRYPGLHFDRVHLSGELAITNLLDRAIELEVRKSLSGELGETSRPPAVTKKARGLRRLNPSLDLVWELTIAPGASEKLSYRYSVLVRR